MASGDLVGKKTRAQVDAELNHLKATRKADGWVTVLQSLIRWGSIVLLAWFAYLSVKALAGQTTLADIGIDFLGKVEISVALAWAVGAGGTAYGWSQRKLRKDTVERLQERIEELEVTIDDQRSSSRLTKRGDTRPEDRV